MHLQNLINSILYFADFHKKSQKSKQKLSEALKLQKLVAPKIWMAEKFYNFCMEEENNDDFH